MAQIKTYRRDEEGILHYREAWTDKSSFRTHFGEVGTKGTAKAQTVRGTALYRQDKPTATQYMRMFKEEAHADGYAEITDEDHGWAVLQVWTHTPDFSHPDDARLLPEGEEALNDFVGWYGIGHCDGYDVGGTPPAIHKLDGTVVNYFCKVVDTEISVKVLRIFTRKFGITQKFVIGTREPGENTDYVLAWSPRKRDKGFNLFGA
ncbi:MAG: hypothetical protein ACTHW1_00085 [Ancrocorticia sp.]|uniref:hypothetical protein n=1 Tax=Ancrocorticia sp. TaxID=2593684 RepID=UPI003F90590B